MKRRTSLIVLAASLLLIFGLMLLAGKSVNQCEAQGGHISSVPPNKGRCVQ